MKPIIGIIGRNHQDFDLNHRLIGTSENLRRAVIKGGGIPIIICPPQDVDYYDAVPSKLPKLTKEDKEFLDRQFKLCDGIIIPGGIKRFEYDVYALEYAIKNDIPTLGICIGMQVMTMLNENGEMVTSNSRIESNINHCQLNEDYVHDVILDKKSILYKILKEEKIRVNSRHTMEVKTTVMFKTYGKSEDGVIEEIEKQDQSFMIGVQWHPEILVHLGDENSKMLFEAFVKAAKEKRYDSKI